MCYPGGRPASATLRKSAAYSVTHELLATWNDGLDRWFEEHRGSDASDVQLLDAFAAQLPWPEVDDDAPRIPGREGFVGLPV